MDTARKPEVAQGAAFAVVVLTAMNLLNYMDRLVPSAVKDLFKADLELTDAQTAVPFTAFVIVYMLTSPIFGALADRSSRKVLVGTGVALWSVATAAAAYATGFWSFLFSRALVGVGEAAYATIAPSLIADYYAPARRNKIMTIFYVAIPIGGAMGYVLGGMLGEHFGWRRAFLMCGLPGLVVAALAFLMREPGRGTFDPPGEKPAAASWGEALRIMARSPAYVFAVLGYTAVTFGTGGMADWFSPFLQREHGMSVGEAGMAVGQVTASAGLLGTAVGGFLADRLRRFTRQPYFALSGLSMILATGASVMALRAGRDVVLTWLFFAQFFLWFYNAPINTVIANSVPSNVVARAFGVSILAIHVLGDAISPTIIGLVSDAFKSAAAPERGNLPVALLIVPATFGLGSLCWLWAWRRIPEAEAAAATGAAPVH